MEVLFKALIAGTLIWAICLLGYVGFQIWQKQDPDVDHTCYMFNPREDITAYELAYIISRHGTHIFIVEDNQLSDFEPYSRHFSKGKCGRLKP